MACHPAHVADEGACERCHRGNASSDRVALAHEHLLSGPAAAHGLRDAGIVSEGRALIDGAACRRCHVIGARGNTLAARLDDVAWQREQEGMRSSLRSPVDYMPQFGFTPRQADIVIAALINQRTDRPTDDRYRVVFARSDGAPTAFDERCGGCHRTLGDLGPVGRRSIGPNLSGVFTSHYPLPRGEAQWTPATLRTWVRNPRSRRPLTSMIPVALTDDEWSIVELALSVRSR